MRFYQFLKAITVLFLLHFDSCPAKAIIIWFTKQMNKHHFQSFIQRCFCENAWSKKVGSFLGKWLRWTTVLIKLQDNVSQIGL